MSDPRKNFVCEKCGNVLNDTQRPWGQDSICPFCEDLKLRNYELICSICGRLETAPFAVGDECICGGLFKARETVLNGK